MRPNDSGCRSRLRPERSALLTGLLLVVLAATSGPSCVMPGPTRSFSPAGETSGNAPVGSTTALWGSRHQHTFGTDGEDLYPCTSSDGATLYYATSRFSSNYQIVAKDVDRTTLEFLTPGDANDVQPAVSPDDARLAFASDRDGTWDLYILDLAPGGKVSRLVTSRSTTVAPRWSPDGTKIVCSRAGLRATGTWEIWTIDAETGAQTFVTEGLLPDWSPDGHWILFQRAQQRESGWFSIWKIRLDGGRPTQVSAGWSDGWGAVTPTWSPDGRWIAFTAVGKLERAADALGLDFGGIPDQDIYVVGADGTKLTNLTADRPWVSEWGPRFAPDGTLFFNSDEEGSPHIWSMSVPMARTAPARNTPAIDSGPGPKAAPDAAASVRAREPGAGTARRAETDSESPAPISR